MQACPRHCLSGRSKIHPKLGRKQSDPGFFRNCTSTPALFSPIPCVHTLFTPAVSPLLPCAHPCPIFTPALYSHLSCVYPHLYSPPPCVHILFTPALCPLLPCVQLLPVFTSPPVFTPVASSGPQWKSLSPKSLSLYPEL